ncbi:MAG: ABC transporter ATP-binding protein [Blastocatellia bacterium]
MSLPFAIKVERLSKRYELGARTSGQQTLRDALVQTARRFNPFARSGARRQSGDVLWALDQVSFELQPGEVVGVIGRNGAGKSTLLKILSRITEPTSGRVEIYGRVGSLLEVGAGFHPELSGRENIYLNGAVLGMRRAEIARRFDEIVAFAEVERFIDTPVKRYSSGMYLRLAFAVAAHLEPEILIVDEVLAVGDAAFQQKCLNKMGAVAQQGRTVLFVSHNLAAVRHLCQRGIMLAGGEVVFDGLAGEAVRTYLSGAEATAHRMSDGLSLTIAQSDPQRRFEVTKVEILDEDGCIKQSLATGDYARFRIEWRADEAVDKAGVELGIHTPEGVPVIHYSTRPVSAMDVRFEQGSNVIECEFPHLPLAAGRYYLAVGLTRPMIEWLYRDDQFALFTVEPGDVFNSGTPLTTARSLIATPHRWLTTEGRAATASQR